MSIDDWKWEGQGATFSDCFLYRYKLWRVWDHTKPTCTFVMLNPSTANAIKTDPTVRKCLGFAHRWGMGAIEVVNAFAWVATDPKGLLDARPDRHITMLHPGYGTTDADKDPVGPGNDHAIAESCSRAVHSGGQIIVAWSAWVTKLGRLDRMFELLETYRDHAFTLGYNQDGTPKHPLYLPYETERVALVHPSWHTIDEPEDRGLYNPAVPSDWCYSCRQEIRPDDERSVHNFSYHSWCWIDV